MENGQNTERVLCVCLSVCLCWGMRDEVVCSRWCRPAIKKASDCQLQAATFPQWMVTKGFIITRPTNTALAGSGSGLGCSRSDMHNPVDRDEIFQTRLWVFICLYILIT